MKQEKRVGKHKKFYGLKVWRKRRALHLKSEPLCRACLRDFHTQTLATVADHIDPTWTDFHGFITGELQSLCKPCHAAKTGFYDGPLMAKRKHTIFKRVEI